MLHFRMCIILKFTQNSLLLIPYLLIDSQQRFVTTLLCHIVFMRNVSVLMGLIILRGLIAAEYQTTIAVATSLGVNQ